MFGGLFGSDISDDLSIVELERHSVVSIVLFIIMCYLGGT